MYFSMDSSFRVVEVDFLASANHCFIFFSETPTNKSFFLSSKKISLNEFHFDYWRKIFSLVETVYLTREFFSTSGNLHWYE